MSAKPVKSSDRVVQDDSAVVESENVFTVLAAQARARSRAGLWTTAIGGALNAGLIFWQSPSLSWLAAACAAAAAYGGWGLIDRAIAARSERADPDAPENSLPDMRSLFAAIGTGAAGLAGVLFMLWVLGSWFR